ncbi:glycosyl hydrolase [Paenibacillus swuensis]|uniref:glycosyl hydrolase n=1 Tax=Paenibacillus swuensis TaxID=1178515 RepID=UPI0008386763|nr:glycosyl hydrolase [Paenibacillus swuensis]
MMMRKLSYAWLMKSLSAAVLLSGLSGLSAIQVGAATVAETKAEVRNYLSTRAAATNNKVVSGQFAHYGDYATMSTFPSEVYTNTGSWAGMVGVDYAFIFQSGGGKYIKYDQPNQVAREYWKQGGLVTVSAHLYNPDNPLLGSKSELANETDIFTPGTTTYNNYREQLAKIADGLKVLRDEGIVVLWRPFHEMNAGWFWWGQMSTAKYKQLWTEMYTYFTNTRGLDNLLWVYAPISNGGTGSEVDDYYPGAGYVDVVGLDVYNSYIDPAHIVGYNELIALNKPFGFTEFGSGDGAGANPAFNWSNLIGGIKASFPKTAFFQAWNGNWTIGRYANTNGNLLMNDSWVANLEDIPAFGRQPNLVRNPGFEWGLTGWTWQNGFARSTADKYAGAYSAGFNGTGSYTNLFQTILTKPNTAYQLKFYAKTGATLGYKIVNSSWAVIASGSTPVNGVWTEYTLNFNSGSNSSVIVSITGLSGVSYVDNFTVVSP